MDPNEILPTITVIRNGNECIINESDFDPATDVVPGKAAPSPTSTRGRPRKAVETEPPAPEPSGVMGILNKGEKFYVVDTGTSEPVEREGLDTDGYLSEDEALQAALAIQQ